MTNNTDINWANAEEEASAELLERIGGAPIMVATFTCLDGSRGGAES